MISPEPGIMVFTVRNYYETINLLKIYLFLFFLWFFMMQFAIKKIRIHGVVFLLVSNVAIFLKNNMCLTCC